MHALQLAVLRPCQQVQSEARRGTEGALSSLLVCTLLPMSGVYNEWKVVRLREEKGRPDAYAQLRTALTIRERKF
jgi:hypothetical protein